MSNNYHSMQFNTFLKAVVTLLPAVSAFERITKEQIAALSGTNAQPIVATPLKAISNSHPMVVVPLTAVNSISDETAKVGFLDVLEQELQGKVNATTINCILGNAAAEEHDDSWYSEPLDSYNGIENATIACGVEYETLKNWNEQKAFRKDETLTYFNYLANGKYQIKADTVYGGDGSYQTVTENQNVLFDSAELSLLVKPEYYMTILSGVSLNSDGFFKCSDYKNWDIKFDLDGKILSIPLMNLSSNHYESEHDLCEPMIATLDSSKSYEMVFGQYVLQNLVSSFEDYALGLAPVTENVYLIQTSGPNINYAGIFSFHALSLHIATTPPLRVCVSGPPAFVSLLFYTFVTL